MGSPNQKYVSGNVPFGGIYVDIYRLADVTDNTSGVKLGRYRVESLAPQDSAMLQKRPDIDGGKGDWWMIEGDCEGNAVIQRNVATTPSLKTGDYFDAAVRVDNAGAPVAERFVIHAPSQEVGQSYRKQNVSVIVDTHAANVNAGNQNSPN